ncbi:THAP-type domain-containing protein [Aphis craccivora]|uniref:THAP-type domain-containing protein n=1 Tax=Aphis craccivora TaxID=307492 RepID=A0A6G0ZR22_APHCR|nr:THAP-type domain-containing protein [Aphis craccivora]
MTLKTLKKFGRPPILQSFEQYVINSRVKTSILLELLFKVKRFKNTSMQIEHLSMMLSFLKKIKVVSKINGTDVTSRMNFINGWLISINGLLKLWVLLNESTRHPSEYVLFTNRLNQDCLENLFAIHYFKDINDILCHINPQKVGPTNVVLPEPSSRGRNIAHSAFASPASTLFRAISDQLE